MAATTESVNNSLSLDDLDITKPCEVGYEFEYVSESNNKSTGVFLTVLGAHSEKVQNWTRKELNKRRMREAMRQKKGKDDVVLIEDDEQFGIESAAVRIIAWRGITQECTKENCIRLCTINPEILSQVIKNSNELGNFIKSK